MWSRRPTTASATRSRWASCRTSRRRGDGFGELWRRAAVGVGCGAMTTVTTPPVAAAAASNVQTGPFASPAGPPAQPVRALGQRVASVDAYRGMVMLLMMGEVLRFGRVAEAKPDSGFWAFLTH